MSEAETSKLLRTILSEISTIKKSLAKESEILSNMKSNTEEQQFLIHHGIKGFKDMVLQNFEKQSKENKISRLYSIFMHDKDLTHPHKKILSYLLEQFSLDKNCFQSIHFSRIVKECRLGKNKAKDYLDLLTQKGFLEKQNDGYRVWYCISSCMLPKENH